MMGSKVPGTLADPDWLMRLGVRSRLGISSNSLTKLVQAGVIRTLRLPHMAHERYSKADVDALIAAGVNGDGAASDTYRRAVESRRALPSEGT